MSRKLDALKAITGGTGNTYTQVLESSKEFAEKSSIASLYKPSGSTTFAALPTPSSSTLGRVYNITDDFTSTDVFVEGAGGSYGAGTNVVVVEPSDGVYKFDILGGQTSSGDGGADDGTIMFKDDLTKDRDIKFANIGEGGTITYSDADKIVRIELSAPLSNNEIETVTLYPSSTGGFEGTVNNNNYKIFYNTDLSGTSFTINNNPSSIYSHAIYKYTFNQNDGSLKIFKHVNGGLNCLDYETDPFVELQTTWDGTTTGHIGGDGYSFEAIDDGYGNISIGSIYLNDLQKEIVFEQYHISNQWGNYDFYPEYYYNINVYYNHIRTYDIAQYTNIFPSIAHNISSVTVSSNTTATINVNFTTIDGGQLPINTFNVVIPQSSYAINELGLHLCGYNFGGHENNISIYNPTDSSITIDADTGLLMVMLMTMPNIYYLM